METIQTGSHSSSEAIILPGEGHGRPVLTQAETNTTLWIGHLHSDPTDHFGGQTFRCPSEGQLDSIQLFADAVQYPGEVSLTLHEFDTETMTWGPSIGESRINVGPADEHRWMRFSFQRLFLKAATTYGFRVKAFDALVALGEAARDNLHPFTFGHEWNADSANERGHYYSYFSLAFKVELRP